MNTKSISTQKGPKTPEQAFILMMHPDYSVPNKVAVLTQLKELAPLFAHEGAAFVKTAPLLQQEHKLQRLAQEILSGLPVGEKRYTTSEQFEKFFPALPRGSRIKFTFAKDKIDKIQGVLDLNTRLLLFSSQELMCLRECVIPSKDWGHITRTYSTVVCTGSDDSIKELATAFAPCVESIELHYTMGQLEQALMGSKSPYQLKLEELRNHHSEADYDPRLFVETVQFLGYLEAGEWIHDFMFNEAMDNVLGKFNSDYARLEFFKAYALKYKLLLAQ